jgi:hypothetical protein
MVIGAYMEAQGVSRLSSYNPNANARQKNKSTRSASSHTKFF